MSRASPLPSGRSIHNGYTFPDGTGDMIDWYINELLEGKF